MTPPPIPSSSITSRTFGTWTRRLAGKIANSMRLFGRWLSTTFRPAGKVPITELRASGPTEATMTPPRKVHITKDEDTGELVITPMDGPVINPQAGGAEASAEALYNAYWNSVKLHFAVPPPSYIQLDGITRQGWIEAANACNAIHDDGALP